MEGKQSEDRFLKEDVLFNYVIELEVLVLKKNDPALEKQQLLSERVAALVARGEKEEKLVRKFLVSAYCARNNLVHQSKGTSAEPPITAPDLSTRSGDGDHAVRRNQEP